MLTPNQKLDREDQMCLQQRRLFRFRYLEKKINER